MVIRNEAMDVCMEDLVRAIILQAVLDYAAALEILKREENTTGKSMNARRMKRDVEAFFRSNWFAMMSDADPKEILGAVKRGEVSAEDIRSRMEDPEESTGGDED